MASLSLRRSAVKLCPSPPSHVPLRRNLPLHTCALKRSPKRLKYGSQRQFNKKGEKMLYVEMDPLGADTWKLEPVIELIKDGGVGVIPTDTVYAIVCDLKNNSSIERLRIIKDIEHSKPLSILCRSLQDIDTYAMGFPRGNAQGQTNIFRAVKHCLPRPASILLFFLQAKNCPNSVQNMELQLMLLESMLVFRCQMMLSAKPS